MLGTWVNICWLIITQLLAQWALSTSYKSRAAKQLTKHIKQNGANARGIRHMELDVCGVNAQLSRWLIFNSGLNNWVFAPPRYVDCICSKHLQQG